jgi:hypothetical protein
MIHYNTLVSKKVQALFIVETEMSQQHFHPPYDKNQRMFWIVDRREETFRGNYQDYFDDVVFLPESAEIETDRYMKKVINGMFSEEELPIILKSLSNIESVNRIVIHKFNLPICNFIDPTLYEGRTLFNNVIYNSGVFDLSVLIPHEEILRLFNDKQISIIGIVQCSRKKENNEIKITNADENNPIGKEENK